MRWFLVLSPVAVIACSGDTDDGVVPDPVACDSVVVGFDPAADAMDVSVDASITVDFDPAVPEGGDWNVALATIDGDAVGGTAEIAADGTSATFTPDADLTYETVFTVTATACDSTESANFLTGAQPLDPTSLEGTTFAILEDDLNITEPAGVGALLGLLELFGTLAVQFTDYDANTESYGGVGAVLDADTDSFFCEQSVNTTVDFSGNPFVSFGPDDLEVEIAPGETLNLEDLTVSGRVAADGGSLQNPTVSLLIASETIPLIELGACPDIAGIPVTCLPCDSSPSGECLLLEGNVETANTIDRDIVAECTPT